MAQMKPHALKEAVRHICSNYMLLKRKCLCRRAVGRVELAVAQVRLEQVLEAPGQIRANHLSQLMALKF